MCHIRGAVNPERFQVRFIPARWRFAPEFSAFVPNSMATPRYVRTMRQQMKLGLVGGPGAFAVLNKFYELL
jgi:hypothetical protein